MKIIYLIRHSLKEKLSADSEVADKQKFEEEKRLSNEGRELAYKLSQVDILKNVDEVWASNYLRAKETANILFSNKDINVSNSFDERHYGDFEENVNKDEFWIKQFKDSDLKNINGESQKEVRERFDNKINHLLKNSNSSEIAIVSHNAAILFYLLKYCILVSAEVPKRLTFSYKNKILIKNSIMKSPSIMKMEFDDDNELMDIKYIEI